MHFLLLWSGQYPLSISLYQDGHTPHPPTHLLKGKEKTPSRDARMAFSRKKILLSFPDNYGSRTYAILLGAIVSVRYSTRKKCSQSKKIQTDRNSREPGNWRCFFATFSSAAQKERAFLIAPIWEKLQTAKVFQTRRRKKIGATPWCYLRKAKSSWCEKRDGEEKLHSQNLPTSLFPEWIYR